jgi:hypothetical protein
MYCICCYSEVDVEKCLINDIIAIRQIENWENDLLWILPDFSEYMKKLATYFSKKILCQECADL